MRTYDRGQLHRALDIVLDIRRAKDEAEFKEADHPRAENGQFGTGNGGASSRTKRVKAAVAALPKVSEAERAAYNKSGFRWLYGGVSENAVVNPIPRASKKDLEDVNKWAVRHTKAIENGKAPIEKVSVASLRTQQPLIEPAAMEKSLASTDKDEQKPITVVRTDAGNFVYDGNHRASAAKLDSEATIDAHVFDIRSWQKEQQVKAALPKKVKEQKLSRQQAESMSDKLDGWGKNAAEQLPENKDLANSLSELKNDLAAGRTEGGKARFDAMHDQYMRAFAKHFDYKGGWKTYKPASDAIERAYDTIRLTDVCKQLRYRTLPRMV